MNEPAPLPGLQAMLELDRRLHEPARLVVLSILYTVKSADFGYLMTQTGLTQGNLSAHLGKLEEGGFIRAKKTFVNKRPKTTLSITPQGRRAFKNYGRTIGAFLNLVGVA